VKVLIFGPAYGHNIESFLMFLNREKSLETTLMYIGGNIFDNKYKNIAFLKVIKNISSLLNVIKAIKSSDIIWVHGNYSWWFAILVALFRKKNSHFSLSLWGESPIQYILTHEDKKSFALKKVFSYADSVLMQWYTIEEFAKQACSDMKTKVIPWGLNKKFLEKNTAYQLSENATNLIDSIKSEKRYKFFYPKSITTASGHDLLVDACKLLADEGITDFIVYIRRGNVDDKVAEKELIENIQSKNLNQFLIYQEYIYLEFKELRALWEEMDCGLQIARNDAFSTTFLEPMLLKKDMIATNIRLYSTFEEKYRLNLNLVELDPKEIAREMKNKITRNGATLSELEKRSLVVKKDFNFENNIPKMIQFFQDEIKRNDIKWKI